MYKVVETPRGFLGIAVPALGDGRAAQICRAWLGSAASLVQLAFAPAIATVDQTETRNDDAGAHGATRDGHTQCDEGRNEERRAERHDQSLRCADPVEFTVESADAGSTNPGCGEPARGTDERESGKGVAPSSRSRLRSVTVGAGWSDLGGDHQSTTGESSFERRIVRMTATTVLTTKRAAVTVMNAEASVKKAGRTMSALKMSAAALSRRA